MAEVLGQIFSDAELKTLIAAFNTVIPEDDDPNGWDGGVARLLNEHIQDFMKWCVNPLKRASVILNEKSTENFNLIFCELDFKIFSELYIIFNSSLLFINTTFLSIIGLWNILEISFLFL